MLRRVGLALLAAAAGCFVACGVLRYAVAPGERTLPANPYSLITETGTGTVFDLRPGTGMAGTGGFLPDAKVTVTTAATGDRSAAHSNPIVVWSVATNTTAMPAGGGATVPVDRTMQKVALDRDTAMAAHCCGDTVADQAGTNLSGTPRTVGEHDGVVLRFPFEVRQQPYMVYDATLGAAAPMDFDAVDVVRGLKVYRFVQTIQPTRIGSVSGVPAALLGFPGAPPMAAPEYYASIRTVWVEPFSGIVIQDSTRTKLTLRDAAGIGDLLTVADYTVATDKAQQTAGGDGVFAADGTTPVMVDAVDQNIRDARQVRQDLVPQVTLPLLLLLTGIALALIAAILLVLALPGRERGLDREAREVPVEPPARESLSS